MEDYLTIQQLSKQMNVPIPTVYVWANQGIIPSQKILGRVLIRKEDVGDIFERYETYKQHKIKKQEKNTK